MIKFFEMNPKVKIGVLVSGGGSNLQAILDAVRTPRLSSAEVSIVISNKPGVRALERAAQAGVEARFLDPKAFANREQYYEEILRLFEERGVDLICLAGFLLKLEPNIVARFKDRILNIHPSLLPRHGGKGMYGHFVHEAVIRAGDAESGCTVHLVDNEFDHGATILQRKVPVLPGDTPEALAERVLKEEHLLYPEAIARYLGSPRFKR
jgi:phosphoribosylglycinamide formyltransferase-1